MGQLSDLDPRTLAAAAELLPAASYRFLVDHLVPAMLRRDLDDLVALSSDRIIVLSA
jgi:hypothetical protein